MTDFWSMLFPPRRRAVPTADSPPPPVRRTARPTPVDVDAAVVTLDVVQVRADERERVRRILEHPLAHDRQAFALHLATSTAITVDAAVGVLRSAPAEPRPERHSWFMSAMQHYSPGVGAFELGSDDVRKLYSR